MVSTASSMEPKRALFLDTTKGLVVPIKKQFSRNVSREIISYSSINLNFMGAGN